MLSRLPLEISNEREDEDHVFCNQVEADLDYEIHNIMDNLPITCRDIARCTSRNPNLGKVYEYTVSGWPAGCQDEEIQPYWNRRYEISVEDGCLLWGRRVIIPSQLQDKIIGELHEGHPGMCRMKALARSFVWWPGLDGDIEDTVRACSICSSTQSSPQKAPLIQWPWPTEPWERVHIDFAEIKGQQFLVVVDSHSKWMEVLPTQLTTAGKTIDLLIPLLASYGLPKELVSDNGLLSLQHSLRRF